MIVGKNTFKEIKCMTISDTTYDDERSKVNFSTNSVKPLFRWAGGKTWLLPHLQKMLNVEFNNYIEPFLGGASVFLWLKQSAKIAVKTYLSDSNEELINAYKVIKKFPNNLYQELLMFRNTSEEYYRIRDIAFTCPVKRAARFYFLNRTCFNGLFRVNLSGKFNVPYGKKKYAELFSLDSINSFSKMLQGAHLRCCDFNQRLEFVSEGDLVFLDPPYTVAHENNGFVKYNQKIFKWEDQLRLKEFIQSIIDRKAFFILTNAYHNSTNKLFSGLGRNIAVSRSSVIGVKKSRRITNELFITNIYS